MNLQYLAYLDLSHNSLSAKSITKDSFDGRTLNETEYGPLALVELNLGHNNLKEIDATTFLHLDNLENLILDANPLGKITDETTGRVAKIVEPSAHLVEFQKSEHFGNAEHSRGTGVFTSSELSLPGFCQSENFAR